MAKVSYEQWRERPGTALPWVGDVESECALVIGEGGGPSVGVPRCVSWQHNGGQARPLTVSPAVGQRGRFGGCREIDGHQHVGRISRSRWAPDGIAAGGDGDTEAIGSFRFHGC